MTSEFARALTANSSASPSSPSTSSCALGTGFLVCLDVPPNTEFGVDYEVFRTGPKFVGVKLLPLGLHFVVFLASDQHQHGARQGFFVNVQSANDVIVRQWNQRDEALGVPPPGFNFESLRNAVLSFQLDGSLGAYPMRHYATWCELSRFITPSVLERCGVGMECLIVPSDSEEDTTSQQLETNLVPSFPNAPRTVCFSSLDITKRESQLDATQRTRYHHERSEQLEALIASTFDGLWEDLLGEFQLAFVLFLQLSSLNAFEQWKKLVSLLCSCEAALHTRLELFCSFLQVLQTQLQQIPQDFFEDEDTSENFLRLALGSLVELLQDDKLEGRLRASGGALRKLVEDRFGLRLELFGNFSFAEVSEYAPVVVLPTELSQSGFSVDSSEEQLNERIALDFLQRHKLSQS